MKQWVLMMPLMLASTWAMAQDCSVLGKQAQSASAMSGLAPELAVPSHQLGAPSGVLAQAFDESQTVDRVALRMRIQDCQQVAAAKKKKSAAAPAEAAAAPEAASANVDPATYKPKTEHDNSPWRFDMNQNGKKMTAEEFDAWMKARGVRVAKGAPAAAAAAPAAAPEVKNEK